jgi:hypothetical protein
MERPDVSLLDAPIVVATTEGSKKAAARLSVCISGEVDWRKC